MVLPSRQELSTEGKRAHPTTGHPGKEPGDAEPAAAPGGAEAGPSEEPAAYYAASPPVVTARRPDQAMKTVKAPVGPPPGLKRVASRALLQNRGVPSVFRGSLGGTELEGEGIHVHAQLRPFAAHLKLSQHC